MFELPPAPYLCWCADVSAVEDTGQPEERRTRKPKVTPRVDAPGEEAARIRALIAELRKNPEYVRKLENAPPLSEKAKRIIAYAVSATDND